MTIERWFGTGYHTGFTDVAHTSSLCKALAAVVYSSVVVTTTNQIYFDVHRDAISISRYPSMSAVEMVCAESALCGRWKTSLL